MIPVVTLFVVGAEAAVGHVTCKVIPKMTYNVLSGMSNCTVVLYYM